MFKNKTIERLIKFLITLLGAGIGATIAALLIPILTHSVPNFPKTTRMYMLIYGGLCLAGAGICFAFSGGLTEKTMKLMNRIEHKWEQMPTQQVILTTFGLIMGLAVAALLTQLILSAGASLITVSFSALTYLVLGYIGMHIGYRRYHEGKPRLHRFRKNSRKGQTGSVLIDSATELLSGEEEEETDEEEEAPAHVSGIPEKFLDTSVIIDGRILDIAKAGFLEGNIVVPEFVLAELRHIADSGDGLRRARGRRGLDVLGKLQKELKNPIVVDSTDYPDVDEVDVKLLRLCKDRNGTVITNDYNLNKVAGVSGLRVLNVNDLANAVKPMLMAGEEMNVQIVREGKEPGQGVAYLDDGTMIVVENGRRFVGEDAAVIVTTVLQTSAGRMIFTKLKETSEKAC